MSKEFNELYDNFIESCHEDEPSPDHAYSGGWHNCKFAVLEILDKYCHVPAYPYIKQEIEKL